jgi:WhiB family redox-sensing transcriptional regulator
MIAAWTDRAACRREDPELFFPLGYGSEFTEQLEQAKAVCKRCPVRDACLDTALDQAENHGLWAGFTPDERRRLRFKRHAHAGASAATEGSKPCNACGETKPLTAFYTDKRATDGRQGRCKACHLAAVKVPPPVSDEEAAENRAVLETALQTPA